MVNELIHKEYPRLSEYVALLDSCQKMGINTENIELSVLPIGDVIQALKDAQRNANPENNFSTERAHRMCGENQQPLTAITNARRTALDNQYNTNFEKNWTKYDDPDSREELTFGMGGWR